MAQSNVSSGDRLRETVSQRFGRAGPEWIVEDVFTGTDGVEYARVKLATNPSQRKTLSISVLSDRRRFVPE